QGGVLSLIECTLVEELDANDEDYNAGGQGFNHLEFKIVVEPPDGPAFSVVLLAPSRQEKAAWTSDISQCIDNIRCNGLMTSVFEENSKVTVPHMIKSDARLHKDDVDICFSKTLNSCKVPQIRYASVERLLERLTDLRFLSIDFLNTFLHTYRIFTTAAVVMDKLADIYKKPFTSIPVRVQYHSSDRLSITSLCPDYSLKITRLALDQKESLELFFATNQGTWGGEHLNNKSPRLCRKFSSPPPLTIPSRTSSPVHSRKLSSPPRLLQSRKCTLVEELDANDEDYNAGGQGFNHLEFKIVVEPPDGPAFSVVLLAPSRQEKAAWTSDISQCIDNIRCNGLMTSVFEENSKVTVPHMIKSDARLHKDDVDICFSKTLNSCKVPQIRYASVERLLERLTDLRFLSIDFLNTFLHTYRIFTTAAVVMDKLADIYKKPFTSIPVRVQYHSSDRLSITSLCPDYSLKITRLALDQKESLELFFATNQGTWGGEHLNNKSPRLCRKFSSPPPLTIPSRTSSPVHSRKLSLSSPVSSKAGVLDLSTPSSSAANSPTSSHPPSISSPPPNATKPPSGFSSPPPTSTRAPSGFSSPPHTCTRAPSLPTVLGVSTSPPTTTKDLSRPTGSPEPVPPTVEEGGDMPRIDAFCGKLRRSIRRAVLETVSLEKFLPESNPQISEDRVPLTESPCRSPSTPRHMRYRQSGGSTGENNRGTMSPASAFAIATAAAGHGSSQGFNNSERTCDKEFIIRRAATNRVLNVLRHWVSKHSQDFEMNSELKVGVMTLLEEVLRDPDLLPQERKATGNILSALSQDEQDDAQLKIEDIIQTADCPKAECFESLSAMELAEQITLLDHIVFRSIPYEEFLGQGWMKLDKSERTPYIMKTSQHFNDMSNLVASQIIAHTDVGSRANSIEKWLAVADICRCLNNYNGVLEITSALNRSAIYRLKKTWAKVCKQTKSLMDRLQKTVSSEGRFKNLRETLKNCNPPCVPYLGMYLTDLAFIEEGTPNFTEEGLVNFSKMRMISHIIREIRQFQGAPYRIEHQPKVTQFLLDKTLVMDEDTLYELSLKIEPRIPPG
ncbi:unnamed protein product, partial [Coregonus sp. 'balchen']